MKCFCVSGKLTKAKQRKLSTLFSLFFFLNQSRQFYCKGNKLKIEEQKAFQVWRDDGLKCSWTLFLKNHLFFFKQQAPLLCLFSMLLLKHELDCLSLHKSKAYQSFLPAPPPYPSGSALLCFWNLPALSNRAPPPPPLGLAGSRMGPNKGCCQVGGVQPMRTETTTPAKSNWDHLCLHTEARERKRKWAES